MRLCHVVQRHKLGLLMGLGVSWAVFTSVTWAVVVRGGPGFDRPLLTFFHQHATPFLNALAIGLTIVGNTGPMVAAAVLITGALWLRGRRRQAWVFALAVGGSMLLTQVIKALVARPRPELWVSIRPEHTFSFPSGHAMDTAALATALGFLAWRHRGRWWVWGLAPLFSLAVGWARLYLGVHHPSDVLAGWCAAVGWVVLVQVLAGTLDHAPRVGIPEEFHKS